MTEEFMQEEKMMTETEEKSAESTEEGNWTVNGQSADRENEPETESEAETEGEREADPEEEKTEEIPENTEEEERTSRSKKKHFKSIMEYFQFGPDEDFSRDDYILARIPDEDLMEYLKMEREREREKRAAREAREKRYLRTFELLAVLVTVAVIVGLLKDNPLVLVNILYIFGILFAVWTWKNPKNPPKE